MVPHRPPLWQVLAASLIVALVLLSLEALVPYKVPIDQAAHSFSGAHVP